jgi:hypothetical protein
MFIRNIKIVDFLPAAALSEYFQKQEFAMESCTWMSDLTFESN